MSIRNSVIFLLSVKSSLYAKEKSSINWPMVVNAIQYKSINKSINQFYEVQCNVPSFSW